MKRILFLNASSEIGGAERNLLNLMSSMRKADPSIEICLLLMTGGPLVREAANIGVDVRVLQLARSMLDMGESKFQGRSRRLAMLSLGWRALVLLPVQMNYVRRLRKAIRAINPTIIHSNGFKTHIFTWLVRWTECPVVWHMHDFLSSRPIIPSVMKLAEKGLGGVIAISNAVAQESRQVLPTTPIHTVYNGIDVEQFAPGPYTGKTLEEMAGLPPAPSGVIRLGLIATYALWKGQDLFLQAAAQYLKEKPDANVRFYIIGGQIYTTRGSQFSREELRNRAHQLDIEKYVGFIDFQKSTAPMYRALDIVVHASTMPEPFGLTITEGMASSRPVIVSQAGGAAELFTNGHDAIGFALGDATSLRKAMQSLIENPELRHRIAGNARETVVTRFNRNRMGPDVLAVYDLILENYQKRHVQKRKRPGLLTPPSVGISTGLSPNNRGRDFRVVFMVQSGDMGGVEHNLLNSMISLRRLLPEAVFSVVCMAQGPFPEACRTEGFSVKVITIPARIAVIIERNNQGQGRLSALTSLSRDALLAGPMIVRFARQLQKTIMDQQPTLIYAAGIKCQLLSGLFSVKQVPIVWHMHDFVASRPMMASALRWAGKNAAGVVALSEAIRDGVEMAVPRVPVTVVRNRVDLQEFYPGPARGDLLDQLAGTPMPPPGSLRIGIVATYAVWKGQDLFLKATAKLLSQHPDIPVCFYVIGGPVTSVPGTQFSTEELRKYAENLGITSKVRFVGFQKETAPVYRELDIVVQASTSPEPFGPTITEAMACGRPVIASQGGGSSELFTHGVDAFGFRPGDADGLANAMLRLIQDAPLRNSLGQNARNTAMRLFNRDQLGTELLAVFDRVISRAGSSIVKMTRTVEPSLADGDLLRQRGDDLHIVFMNPIGELGGGERNLLDIITVIHNSLPEARLHLICFADGPFCRAVEKLGVPVTVLPLPNRVAAIGDSALKGSSSLVAAQALLWRFLPAMGDILRFSKQLRDTLEKLQPSIVHTNGIKCHVMSRLMKYPTAPILWQMQDFVATRPLVGRGLRWASKSVAGAVAISEAVSRDIQKVAPRVPATVIYSAINTDYFSPSADRPYDLDALAGLPPAPPGTLRIALVAAYARWKGQDVFIEAAARVLKDHPYAVCRFFIVGGPIYSTQGSQFSVEELRGMAKNLQIDSQVGFVPFQQDVADVYRSADICVHASSQPEPFGRTIVEAMATAKPVIVSRAGGAAELFTHGYDALGVPPGDVAALAQAIMRLLQDPELRASLSQNARKTAVAKYSRDRMAPELHHLYEHTIRMHALTHPDLKGSKAITASVIQDPVVSAARK